MINPLVSTKEIITPIGQMLAAATPEGVFFLDFAENLTLGFKLKKALTILGCTFRERNQIDTNPHLLKLDTEIKEYFAGKRQTFTVPIVLAGTEFQKKAWKTLLKIPYGVTWSYSYQAACMGSPKSVRSVGTANGKNNIAIIIPCHRVIAKDGSLSGYAGGLWRKEYLLSLEKGSL